MITRTQWAELNRKPVHYAWQPQGDITVYELALCLPLMVWRFESEEEFNERVEALPAEARRHFKEIHNRPECDYTQEKQARSRLFSEIHDCV